MTELSVKRRADSGHVRLNERDLNAIEWIFDMGAIFEVDIQQLVSPKAPLSRNAVRSVVRRWEKAGVVRAEPILAGRGRLVRLTTEGACLVSEGTLDVPAQEVTPTRSVRHALAGRARLQIERSSVATLQMRGWVSERQWRLENVASTMAGDHVPHGVVVFDAGVVGMVHVAHTAVELGRLRLLLADIFQRHPFVIAVVPPELTAAARLLVAVQAADTATTARLEVVEL
ncbi:hypothetical protein MXD61_14225 [Frankia sp. AgPm24]|uniref:hypothetical protein n=1 Tax=Frankia sp. AgPm24 TaxID=631128 RepID=UPI00200EB5FD|nr:hypothetical protein [Frankia sp. AgPm24]MCK9923012.1 hypothetical protein [Frankia sp. AgPm24]